MTITAEPPTVIGTDAVEPDDHTTTHQDPDSAAAATALPPVQAEDADGGSEQDGAAATSDPDTEQVLSTAPDPDNGDDTGDGGDPDIGDDPDTTDPGTTDPGGVDPEADLAEVPHGEGTPTDGESVALTPAEVAAALQAETVIPDDAPTFPIYEIGHTGEVDPASLVIGANRRKKVPLTRSFIGTIKARGVKRRIHVYQDEAGHLIVEDGQRRTRGAIKAGRELVPFEVIENPTVANLIYDQLALNDHELMTTGDIARAHLQLSLLGEKAGTIARNSGRGPKEVKSLIAVASSAAATSVADQYDLDLPQLLAFAEFEGDEAAQRRLHTAIGHGNFTHVAQQLRDDRDERAARQKLIDEAKAQGMPVVDFAGYGCREQTLRRLGITGEDAVREHQEKCAGRAVCIESTWVGNGRAWIASPVCLDAVANGHTVPDHVKQDVGLATKKKVADMSPKEAEAARKARKEVIDNNKAWQSAVVVRRKWIAEEFAKRTKVPAGAELFIAGELLRNPFFLRDGLTNGLTPLADVVLPVGGKRPLHGTELAKDVIAKIGPSTPATSRKAIVIAATLIFYAWEDKHGGDDQGKNTWRRFNEHDTRILLQMETWGYPLSDVERLVAHPKPKTEPRRRRKTGQSATAVASSGGPEEPAAEVPGDQAAGDEDAAGDQADDDTATDDDVQPDAEHGDEAVSEGAVGAGADFPDGRIEDLAVDGSAEDQTADTSREQSDDAHV